MGDLSVEVRRGALANGGVGNGGANGKFSPLAFLGNLRCARGLVEDRGAKNGIAPGLSDVIPKGLEPSYITPEIWSGYNWAPDKRVRYIILLDRVMDANSNRAAANWFGGPRALYEGLLKKLGNVTFLVMV